MDIPKLKWAKKERLVFIESLLINKGSFNREDLIKRFGISVPCASLDISSYKKMEPQNIFYDGSAKQYFKGITFQAIFHNSMLLPAATDDDFYVQDSRTYVGNDVLWHQKEFNGYTTDLSKAMVVSKADAQAMHNERHTDIPWPKAYIDSKVRPAVDMQYIKRDEALVNTGIILRSALDRLREQGNGSLLRCSRCGRFTGSNGHCANCFHE